jgi:hypothetical protein
MTMENVLAIGGGVIWGITHPDLPGKVRGMRDQGCWTDKARPVRCV